MRLYAAIDLDANNNYLAFIEKKASTTTEPEAIGPQRIGGLYSFYFLRIPVG
jgi:hypothetical protein